jgi:hypothetical protein
LAGQVVHADMGMLADLVGEVVSSIVGEAITELLFPGGVSKPQPPPRQGEWNASLGSLAAFLAGIAALFCGISAYGVLRGVGEPLLWVFLGGSVLVAMLSGVLAHRALEVTGRRRALARIGLWLSRATIIAGLFAALVAGARLAVPSP